EALTDFREGRGPTFRSIPAWIDEPMGDRLGLRERIGDNGAKEISGTANAEARRLVQHQCIVGNEKYISRIVLCVVVETRKLGAFDLSNRLGNDRQGNPFVGVHGPSQVGEIDDHYVARHGPWLGTRGPAVGQAIAFRERGAG